MKNIFAPLALLICIPLFTQNVDMENAPENPIALPYKLAHFNLKGDVYNYDSRLYFNKEGFLIRKSDYAGENTYTYKNGKLIGDAYSNELKVNDNGFITLRRTNYSTIDYSYNDKGLLTSIIETKPEAYNSPLKIDTKKYVYDAQNRIIKQEIYSSQILKETTTYTYKKIGNTVQVFAEVTKTDEKPYHTEKHYINGRLILSNDQYDTIPLKIASKLDAFGNSIEDKHINDGTLTDTFNYTIIYYSEANKPQNYTVFIKKAYDGSIIPQIHKNGNYFYTKLKTPLESTLDMLFYDDLTKNYYLAKNAYDKTLPEGTTIKFELISKNNEVLTFINLKEEIIIFNKCENVLKNSEAKAASFNINHLFVYTKDTKTKQEQTFFFKDAKGKTFASGILLPENKAPLYYYHDKTTDGIVLVFKGELVKNVSLNNTKKIGDCGIVINLEGKPTYVLPDYCKLEIDKIYAGRFYDATLDKVVENENQEITNSIVTNKNCISGNCTNGYGKYKALNGDILEGFFTNEKVNGFGSQTYTTGDTYTGNYVDGKREGYGIYLWKSTNTQYYGEWKTDKIHGYGYSVTKNEITQAGIYTNGKLTTDLLIDYKNKKYSTNNCLGDCNNGFGSIQYSGGDSYTGFFINGKSAKLGKHIWIKFDKVFAEYTGQFDANGQTNGTGKYVQGNSTYFGEILQGKLTGKALKINTQTNKETYGEFIDDKLVKDYSINSNTTSNNTNIPITNSLPSETCISGNCIDGYGILKTKDASTITGFFKNSQPNGYGIEVYNDASAYYEGTFKNGLRDGYGYYKWVKTGQNYIGLWKEGLQHGYGYYSNNGIVTQAGYYEKGKQIQNMLTQNYINKILKDNCLGDCINGFGSLKYSNNDMYTGFFKNGEKNYVGGYLWANGNGYTGEYYNGIRNGEGEEFYGSVETTYHGTFVNGQRQGNGAYFNKSGDLLNKGYWENGELKTSY